MEEREELQLPKQPHFFGIENFPEWLRSDVTQYLVESRDVFTDRGIATDSVTCSADITLWGAKVDIHTSIGVIPVRFAHPTAPQEAP